MLKVLTQHSPDNKKYKEGCGSFPVGVYSTQYEM